jgi:uncharacterized membrane protein (DUF106 family)
LLPLKSITLEKLEKMQKEAQEVLKNVEELRKDSSSDQMTTTTTTAQPTSQLEGIAEETNELS